MSEYQYYEFAAIDGPISDEGMEYAEGCSSRADVSPFRWCNVYNYGDFHGSVETLLKYYDAHFYISNWGSVQFALAFPEGCLNRKNVQTYLPDDDGYDQTLRFEYLDDRCIVWWEWNDEEGGGWAEGEGIINSLIGVREEMISGDYRALFLGWLADFCPDDWSDPRDSDVLVPLVPTGLGSLTHSQQALIEQFPVDPDALVVANGLSQDAMKDRIPITTVLDKLPVTELKTLLQSVAEGYGSRVMSTLNRLTYPPVEIPTGQTMTCVDFANKVIKMREVRLREEAKAEAEKRKRAIAAHKLHLESVMKRTGEIWAGLDSLMVRKSASIYDNVAAQLIELRDAYKQTGDDSEFQGRLATFRARYRGRPAMMRRIEDL